MYIWINIPNNFELTDDAWLVPPVPSPHMLLAPRPFPFLNLFALLFLACGRHSVMNLVQAQASSVCSVFFFFFFLAGPFVPVYFSRVSLVPVPPPCPLLCCGFVHITNWDVFFVSGLFCIDYRKSEVERSYKADGIKLGLVQFYGASHFNYLATGHPKI